MYFVVFSLLGYHQDDHLSCGGFHIKDGGWGRDKVSCSFTRVYQTLSAVDSTNILRRILLFHAHQALTGPVFFEFWMCPKHRTVKEVSGEDGWVLVASDASRSYHASVVNIHSWKPILSYIHWFMQVLVDLLFYHYPFADSASIILRFISYLIQFEPSLFPFSDRSPPTLARRGVCTATPWCQVVASVPREMKKWRALEQGTKKTPGCFCYLPWSLYPPN